VIKNIIYYKTAQSISAIDMSQDQMIQYIENIEKIIRQSSVLRRFVSNINRMLDILKITNYEEFKILAPSCVKNQNRTIDYYKNKISNLTNDKVFADILEQFKKLFTENNTINNTILKTLDEIIYNLTTQYIENNHKIIQELNKKDISQLNKIYKIRKYQIENQQITPVMQFTNLSTVKQSLEQLTTLLEAPIKNHMITQQQKQHIIDTLLTADQFLKSYKCLKILFKKAEELCELLKNNNNHSLNESAIFINEILKLLQEFKQYAESSLDACHAIFNDQLKNFNKEILQTQLFYFIGLLEGIVIKMYKIPSTLYSDLSIYHQQQDISDSLIQVYTQDTHTQKHIHKNSLSTKQLIEQLKAVELDMLNYIVPYYISASTKESLKN
jgi:hypothetical protein